MEHEDKKIRVVIVGGGRMCGRTLQAAAALKKMEAVVISEDECHYEISEPDAFIYRAVPKLSQEHYIARDKRPLRQKGRNKNRWR